MIVEVLKAHYTLKCTSWLISPDLLRASVTPPTTAEIVSPNINLQLRVEGLSEGTI